MYRKHLEGADLLSEVARVDGLTTAGAIAAIEDASGVQFDNGALYDWRCDSQAGNEPSLARDDSPILRMLTDSEIEDIERMARKGAGERFLGQSVNLDRFKGRAARAVTVPPRQFSERKS